MTREYLTSRTDSYDLASAVIKAVIARMRDDRVTSDQVLRGLPREFEVVFMTWDLQTEVHNGGFNQYFWNNGTEWVDEAIAGFETLGAARYADMVREALEILESEADLQEEAREKASLENPFQPFCDLQNESRLHDLDYRFYEMEAEVEMGEELHDLQARYILEHLDQFVTEPDSGPSSDDETHQARRKRLARILALLEVENVPDPDTLNRQLEDAHEPGGLPE